MIIALAALAVTAIAAVVQAVVLRRWWRGIGVIVAPTIGAVLILWALANRAGYFGGGNLNMPLLIVFVLVLLGIAVREAGARVLPVRRSDE
ncbi:MAG: hypothetical protein QM662_02670 [Gordonia sp. (in: high G+C Gram-positive bacteria)]